jgi:hypothetical protein
MSDAAEREGAEIRTWPEKRETTDDQTDFMDSDTTGVEWSQMESSTCVQADSTSTTNLPV